MAQAKLVYGTIDNSGILRIKLTSNCYAFLPRFMLGNNIVGSYIFKLPSSGIIADGNLTPLCRCRGELKDFIIELINNKRCYLDIYLYRLLYHISKKKLKFETIDSKKVEKIYNKLCNITSNTSLKEIEEITHDDYLIYTLRQISIYLFSNTILKNEDIVYYLSKPQPTSKQKFEINLKDDENFFDPIAYHSIVVEAYYLNREYPHPLKLDIALESKKDLCLNYNLEFINQTSCYTVKKIYELSRKRILITI